MSSAIQTNLPSSEALVSQAGTSIPLYLDLGSWQHLALLNNIH